MSASASTSTASFVPGDRVRLVDSMASLAHVEFEIDERLSPTRVAIRGRDPNSGRCHRFVIHQKKLRTVPEIVCSSSAAAEIDNVQVNHVVEEEEEEEDDEQKLLSSSEIEPTKVTMVLQLASEDLACCVCYEPFINGNKVYQCMNGGAHHVCETCLQRLRETSPTPAAVLCPIDRTPGGFILDRLFMSAVDRLLVPCTVSSHCPHRTFPWLRAAHRAECSYVEGRCPACGKLLSMKYAIFLEHVRQHHTDQIVPYTSREPWPDSQIRYLHGRDEMLLVRKTTVASSNYVELAFLHLTDRVESTDTTAFINVMVGSDPYVKHYAHVGVQCTVAQWFAKCATTESGAWLSQFHTPIVVHASDLESLVVERMWKKGDPVEALDTQKKRLIAQIIDAPPDGGPGDVYISYDGWSARWNEWMPVDSTRLLIPSISALAQRLAGKRELSSSSS